MIEKAIQMARQNIELPQPVIDAVMEEIFSDSINDSLIATFLTELSVKGETASEISNASKKFRSLYYSPFKGKDAVEVIGTGGDGSNSFNISTTASFIAAGMEVPIIKHGNHAATSLSGSADVLQKLGVNIHIPINFAYDIFCNTGICFLFNAQFPTIMKKVAKARRELNFVTLFNKLRWISPASATMEFLGVYSDQVMSTMSETLKNSCLKRATIVHAVDGLDEVSLSSPTYVININNNQYEKYVFDPELYGMHLCHKKELLGGSPLENALITKNILQGNDKGAKRQIAVLNAAFIIMVYYPHISLMDAVEMANESIDSGKALNKLNALVLATHSVEGLS